MDTGSQSHMEKCLWYAQTIQGVESMEVDTNSFFHISTISPSVSSTGWGNAYDLSLHQLPEAHGIMCGRFHVYYTVREQEIWL